MAREDHFTKGALVELTSWLNTSKVEVQYGICVLTRPHNLRFEKGTRGFVVGAAYGWAKGFLVVDIEHGERDTVRVIVHCNQLVVIDGDGKHVVGSRNLLAERFSPGSSVRISRALEVRHAYPKGDTWGISDRFSSLPEDSNGIAVGTFGGFVVVALTGFPGQETVHVPKDAVVLA